MQVAEANMMFDIVLCWTVKSRLQSFVTATQDMLLATFDAVRQCGTVSREAPSARHDMEE